MNGLRYSYDWYSDNSGILFAGAKGIYRPIELQTELSADSIAIDLSEISREGLTNDAQVHLVESVDEKKKKDGKGEEKL